ncbi:MULTISPECIES: MFS transporter [Pseudomonas]|uniref:MFS transporter n=1 Tax=Pseudomonas TaxID=286 RepID=UPI0007B3DAB3|nr:MULTISPECIES: MFS transporter [Pseudomonas]AZC51341.1 putative MFS-type transporter [Pseudomonas chlororaphis subsp. piscium]AZC57912.1 putative MFS-type transporter [Pseudomonas chlororaphis subsp. piscium]AZC64144.1 putative MFS-type transporter [Pseudomonas chlororaphis subsp. piscium]AZC70367.1 putative MFS-type transporter [Pseudomonas chlororaphis subsp. piscium]AZC76634.1 putative MFS-type transporter [Pseudomonas chlororaphis subsp. piscium]
MSWFSDLNKKEKSTFISAFGGWALDALDFMIFTFVIATLMSLWHIDKGQAGMLSTVTLLFSAVGGWGAGILADRYGRVRILQITILWFSLCTVLIGFAQNFEQIFVLRALQGLGFGGEWAVGSVLMGEIVRSEHRGKAVGTVQSGWAIGWGAAALLYTLAFSLLPEDWAWRTLFWIGVIPALLVLYIRKHVPEPEVFQRAQREQQSKAQRVSPLVIFSPALLKTTLLAALLCTGVQGGYYAITTWLPTFLKTERHLSVVGTGGYLMVIILGSFVGYICGAYLTDKLGRRANLLIFALLSSVTIFAYTQLELSNSQMLFLGFPLGFAASGIFSGMGAFLTELYPSAVRATGQGFTYNFGRGIGALFPGLVGYLSQTSSLASAIGMFAGGAYGVVLVVTLLLPETKGKQLD